MSSREDILQSIRRNTRVLYEKPDYALLEKEAIVYPDKLVQFQKIMEMMGGRAIILQDGEDVNDVIRRQYPSAERIATCIDAVEAGGKE